MSGPVPVYGQLHQMMHLMKAHSKIVHPKKQMSERLFVYSMIQIPAFSADMVT